MSSIDYSVFIGREEFLQTLRATLLRDRKAVITGMSGVGKTALARAYARRFSQEYQLVCWLNMATDETFLADLHAALRAHSLPVNRAKGAAGLFQTFQDYLSTQKDFLLVLDNPPRSFQLQQSVGQRRMDGHLLVVTDSIDGSVRVPCLELTGLEAPEGALLVLRRAGLLDAHAQLEQADEEQRLAALELARELHGLPIALNLAAGYVRESGCGIRDYLFAFRDCAPRLRLPADSGGEDLSEIAVACELSLARLEQARSEALESLRMVALLLPEALPAALFLRAAGSEENRPDWQQDAQSLLTYGLITIDNESSALNMHPLVQELVRQFFALDRPLQQVEQALRRFQQLLPTLKTEEPPTRLRAAGHIRHLEQLSRPLDLFFSEAADVFYWAASILLEQGLVAIAEPLFRRTLAIWEHLLGSADPRAASVLYELSALHSLLKNYGEAEVLAQRAIASKSRALGVNHPDVMLALDHLGHIYAAQGKLQKARLCYEKAISLGDRVGLHRHSAYNTARYDLALLLVAQKQFEQAEQLLRKICLVWEHDLGPQSPSTMAARFSLAEVSTRLQNWKRAETCYRQALPVCERLLGEEHPMTLGHLEQAALVFLRRGDLAEAERGLRRVLEVRERTLGAWHPALASCLNGLARVALAKNQFPEAQALLERARGIYAAQAEPAALAQAEVLDTLAALEALQQHNEQARDAYQHALDLRRQILGEEDVDLIESLHNLAAFYLSREQPQQAEPLLLRALAIYQRAERPEDLLLDPVLTSLAEIELRRQHFARAKAYLERARAVREQALGRADPRTSEIAQKLAELARAQEMPAAENVPEK